MPSDGASYHIVCCFQVLAPLLYFSVGMTSQGVHASATPSRNKTGTFVCWFPFIFSPFLSPVSLFGVNFWKIRKMENLKTSEKIETFLQNSESDVHLHTNFHRFIALSIGDSSTQPRRLPPEYDVTRWQQCACVRACPITWLWGASTVSGRWGRHWFSSLQWSVSVHHTYVFME